MKKILITGGAGFIGSHVVRLFVKKYPQYFILNLDKLTYSGNLKNVSDLEREKNYKFQKMDICDKASINEVFREYKIDHVIHLAAESHVDRSITQPDAFAKTNVLGTLNLLDCALQHWKEDFSNKLFYHISTDEVYGSLGKDGYFVETTAYDPNSPYSASKAASDHFVRAYGATYNLPYVITNCSNNYGPNQFPEKLIPLVIFNILNNKPIPVYGNGDYTRDWLFVLDHADAIDKVFHANVKSETYNIGGLNEWTNINLIRLLCEIMDEKLNYVSGTSEKLIEFVKDRPGHDKRYAIDARKIKNDLGWHPSVKFEEGIKRTVDWYLSNQEWLKEVTSGAYMEYYDKQYSKR